VDTAALKTIGVMDRDLELDEDYCKRYQNGTDIYDPTGKLTDLRKA